MSAGAKRVTLGIDLGAGSLKASLVDETGETLGEAARHIATAAPRPGWSEQDPADWWQALCGAVPDALAKAGVAADKVAAVGLSGGAHIAVLEDAAGRVVRPAILWNDQRSAAEAEELHARAGDLIIEKGLNRANPTWTLCQLAWLQKHEPDIIARSARLYISKDWLRSRLTGDWTSDYSDALGALMSDVETRGWSAEICDLIGWDRAKLPPLHEPQAVAGVVQAEAARACGLKEGTPVVVGSNDTTVELYGAGAIAPGQGAIKLATAGVVFLAAGRPEVHPPVSCYPHIMPGLWYMASGINACATAHRWVRDTFFSELPAESAFEEMDHLAATVPPGCDGLIFHPYLMGERAPHWDPKLRGDFIGMTLSHNRAHFARACYEGIAFALNDVLQTAKRLSGATFSDMRLLGGGARSATWRQIIADVTGLTVKVPVNGDASFGAALVAAVGAGIFASPEAAVARCVRISEENRPDPERHAAYQRAFALYDAARRGLTDINHRLHDDT